MRRLRDKAHSITEKKKGRATRDRHGFVGRRTDKGRDIVDDVAYVAIGALLCFARQCRHSELDNSESWKCSRGPRPLTSTTTTSCYWRWGGSTTCFRTLEEGAAFLCERLRALRVGGSDADLSYAGGGALRRRRGVATLHDQGPGRRYISGRRDNIDNTGPRRRAARLRRAFAGLRPGLCLRRPPRG